MNVLFSCHVRKVTGIARALPTRGLGGDLPIVRVKPWEAKGEEGMLEGL